MKPSTKILCSGATGFIGSHLLPKLVESGHEVVALHRYVTGRYVLGENVETVFADLQDFSGVNRAIKQVKPDIVINLAAISPVAYSYSHPQIVTEVNYLGVINLAESCRKHVPELQQFIQAGTSEEYGNQPAIDGYIHPIKEDARLYPNSPYAVAKVAATKYLEYMRDAYGFPMTIVRPFNTFGRKKNKHFVVERIVTQMLSGVKEIRLGDPDPIRDMLFREDHVSAYLHVLGIQKAIGETFNFCTGEGYSIADMVDYCRSATDWSGDVIWNTIPRRPLDIDVLIGDPTKANNGLGWKHKWDLKRGIEWCAGYWEKILTP